MMLFIANNSISQTLYEYNYEFFYNCSEQNIDSGYRIFHTGIVQLMRWCQQPIDNTLTKVDGDM